MNLRRNLAALGAALVMALASAGATLASTATGSTTDSVTVTATISMTVPASITYPGGSAAAIETAIVGITAISTDNPTGLSIGMTVNADGAGKITLAKRKENLGAAPPATGGMTVGTAVSYGYFTSSSTSWPAGTSTGPVSGGSVSFTSNVDTTTYAPGTYTGTLSFTATTNP